MDKSEGGSSKEQEREHNPNVQFGVNNRDVQNQRLRTQGPNHADQIGNTRHIGSSSRLSRGTMGNQRNVLGQSIDGTRLVVNSMSSSLGTMSNQMNVLSQGRTQSGLNLASSSLGTMSNKGKLLGQGIDGTRPMVNSTSSSLGTRANPIVVSDESDIRTKRVSGVNLITHMYRSASSSLRTAIRQQLSSSGENQVTVSTQADNSHTTSPTNDQILDPSQLLNNMSYPLPPYVPRIRPRPYMHVITRSPPSVTMVPPRVEMHPLMVQVAPPTDSMRTSVVRMVPPMVQMRPPVVQMVPSMVEMRPPVVQMVPPMVEMRPPVVQMVPPMVEMRPPMVQTGNQRVNFVCGPASPSMNINMGVQPGGGIQQGSYSSDEVTSQRRRSQDDEAESSRDAKRLKR